MKRRIVYPLVIVGLLLIVFVVISPLLSNQVEQNLISQQESKTLFLNLCYGISIVLALILLYEGRHYKNMYPMILLIIVTRVVDAYRFYIYPLKPFEENIVSVFGGLLIFAFGLALWRDIFYKNKAGIQLLIVGVFTAIRFPYFTDMLYYYLRKFGSPLGVYHTYFLGVLFFHLMIVMMMLFALDNIIQDNQYKYLYNKE